MKFKITLILFLFCLNFSFAQIFEDNFSRDSIGEFPANWKALRGYAQVTPIASGEKLLQFTEGQNYIKPIVEGLTDNYLDDKFTLEFDAFFDETHTTRNQYYTLRLWDGHNYNNGEIRMNPITIYRDGVWTSYFNPKKVTIQKRRDKLDPKNNFNQDTGNYEYKWHHLKLEYNQGVLKLFLDDQREFIINDLPFKPTMFSIGAYEATNAKKNYFTAIANVKLHDRILENPPPVIADVPSPNDSGSSTNDPGDTSTNDDIIINEETDANVTNSTAKYRFKFDWLVVYEANDGGLGNSNLELYGDFGGSYGIYVNQGNTRIMDYNGLQRIHKTNAKSVSKNDGTLMPGSAHISDLIIADSYGYPDLEYFEEHAFLKVSYTLKERDPTSFDEVFLESKTIPFRDILNSRTLTKQEVLEARNQDITNILYFHEGGNRMGLSFTFERID